MMIWPVLALLALIAFILRQNSKLREEVLEQQQFIRYQQSVIRLKDDVSSYVPPDTVAVLPCAGFKHHGQRLRYLDKIYQCILDGSGCYVWVQEDP